MCMLTDKYLFESAMRSVIFVMMIQVVSKISSSLSRMLFVQVHVHEWSAVVRK